MAPQRVADAANISPYPFVVRQGRPVIDPVPENPEPSGRSKKAMAKARRAERNARQEEERRFNTGPRNIRSHPSSKGGRRFRLPGRGYEDRNGIPDYPPPTFQEAMTSPPMSGCSSTTAIAQAPMAPVVVPERAPEVVLSHTAEDAEASTEHPAVGHDHTGSDGNESNSDESIFIIDKNSIPVASTDLPRGAALEERVKMDWIKRRGIEFPISPSPEPLRKSSEAKEDAIGIRGRSTTRLPTLTIDSDPASGEDNSGASSPVTSAKRRFLSLSPLRTIFPPRSPVHQDRAMSAHPSPSVSSSPYSGSRVFFRSTTSLATMSFLRLPGSTFSGKSEISLSRKLFNYKGKERAKDTSYNDSWEVVDESDYGEPEDIRHRPSLMAAVEAISSNASLTSASPGTSPTRSQSFTFGCSQVSVDSVRTALPKRPYMPSSDIAQDVQARTASEPTTSTSVKVCKGSSMAFIDRPVIRRPGGDPSTCIPEGPEMARTPTAPVVVPYQDNASMPLLTGTPHSSVRSRANAPSPPPSLLTKRHTSHVLSPLRANTNAKPSLTINQQATTVYQCALETPLPATPDFHSRFDYGSPAASRSFVALPSNASFKDDREILPPPLVPVPSPVLGTARSSLDLLTDSNPGPVPLAPPCQCRSASPPAPLNVPVFPATVAGNQPVKKSNSSSSAEEQPPMTPTKHYIGRPLPRPPPSVATTTRAGTVDSTYAAPEGSHEWNVESNSGSGAARTLKNCPEGLLIDLEDTSLDGFSASGTSTPRSDEGLWRSQSHLHLPMAPSVASLVDLSPGPGPPASAPADLSSLSFASMQVTSTPLSATRHGAGRVPYVQPNSPSFSDLTNLDLLVSHLQDGEHDGTDYETLLLVSEIIGPANPTSPVPSHASSPPTSSTSQRTSTSDSTNMSLVGRIELMRRRVTADGRVKLKLKLLDVTVNKCGICLAQFKDGDMAALTSDCRHSFHEKCLARWISRSKTCPMCRVLLDTDIR